MIKRTKKGISFYEFELFKNFKGLLRHGVLPRQSSIDKRDVFNAILGENKRPLSFLKQLHGDKIIIAGKFDEKLTGDALITKKQGFPLLIRIADCASIIIFDPMKKVIGNIHAGWRGIAKRIIKNTVLTFQNRFGSNPKNLIIGISPMLGPCCSQFSDPEKELPRFMHGYIGEENMVNLWAAVEGQLKECGIPESNIENPRICTACNIKNFYSYRKEGEKSGRFGTVIMLC